MVRILSILLVSLLGLAACDTGYDAQSTGSSASGLSTKVYRIRGGDTSKVQYRMLDSINALRQAAGTTPVKLDARLNAAAATHSRDMSVQNRPWHFSSDGSSPLDRVQRAGYDRAMLGENISETYETELETLAAWMEEPGTRSVILDKKATDLGFAWFQEGNGKIWWTLVMGG
ncbi:CAP domain-containing protein [Antarcticimicrobium sediminis]|uniref:CAP domain-containing protein n=1 Tax=Antarcticimicrobium sediminis TaxID=2546227 RepID=A0A4R5EQG0_9RHOB|nr:CAP domain-containing protein [Antarcticimicrobium sediminis]TDE37029.1 CAP domain-containing protein [Antarcticimicrobium sediminis]